MNEPTVYSLGLHVEREGFEPGFGIGLVATRDEIGLALLLWRAGILVGWKITNG